MNIFRLIADALHLLSIIILLLKIRKTRSAAGISFKSQLLYFLVFLLRYLDLFTRFLSFYNSAMKIFFLISSGYVVYLMKKKFKATWDPTLDTFHAEFLVIGAALIGIVLASKYTLLEIAWSISIWLEAVAIVPQFFQLQRTGEAETITTHYLFAL
ncbi:endoplasmic reticulum retention protein, partial [Coelomomyces lativittatus]